MKRVGIIGLGTVGGGFYDIARKRKEFQISKVLNRSKEKYFSHNVSSDQIAENVDDIIKNVDIVVETVGGIDFPYDVIKRSLLMGKDVVTANKALIALKGDELVKLAKDSQRKLLFSASVGGGMPALRNVKYHAYGKINRIYGILNATSNFVLSKISNGMTMEEAIKIAQKEGYAEQDPTDDISGMDAARKIDIICALVSKKLLNVNKLPRLEIKITPEELEYSKMLKTTIKPLVYLAFNSKKPEEVEIWSGPVAIPEYSRISQINGTENCLVIEGESGTNFITGIGAGSNPTAFAVMADVISIVENETYDVYFQKDEKLKIKAPNFEEFKGLKIFHPTV